MFVVTFQITFNIDRPNYFTLFNHQNPTAKLSITVFFVGMLNNCPFYDPGPISEQTGGILLFSYSMINAYGIAF